MRKFLSVACFAFISIITFAQIPINEARNMAIGDVVIVEGIVTNGDELGPIRYMQDATGAIPVFPGTGSIANFANNVKRGDLIRVEAPLKEFNGLLELDPVMSYTIISSGNDLPDPLLVSISDINEANEAKLVRVEDVKFDIGGSVFSVGNFSFSKGNETGEIYVRSGHELIGTEIPLASVNLNGLASEFNGLYQLIIRDKNDIEIRDNFFISTSPVQSDLDLDGFTVSWETNVPGNTILRYGTTTALGEEMVISEMETNHSITLTGLSANEFYYIKAASNNGTTEVESSVRYYATGSESSGTLKVYFTLDVDGRVSNGNYANGTSGAIAEAAIIERINAAEETIDIAVYNINRTGIVEALTNAHNRGVVVRYIADNETANLALANPTPPFGIIRGNIDGLMHNKFLSIDASSLDNAWLIMGSMNLTEENIGRDANNMIFIQDQSLARAYRVEFEEMWGTDGPSPGIFNVRFGAAKTDNTPHMFEVNGLMLEQYFSPSDNVTLAMIDRIKSANTDVEFAILSFTNNELGNAIVDAHNDGPIVRGIIDNINDQGGEYPFLLNAGVNVTPDNVSRQTHHKYCLIDASDPSSDPTVITGSHNWSAGAETRNDENTLIIHDAIIANIFLQEFEARWCEATGGTNCTTATENVDKLDGIEFSVSPNPIVNSTSLNINLDVVSDIAINVFTMNGQRLSSTVYRNLIGTHTFEQSFAGFSSGSYIMQVVANGQASSKVLNVIR